MYTEQNAGFLSFLYHVVLNLRLSHMIEENTDLFLVVLMLQTNNHPQWEFIPSKFRARHWCLSHCPGQVEFVNYSCGASENCISLGPLGKYVLYISGLLLRMCASFRGLPSKLVLENMLPHARTMFYLVLNEIL